MDALTNFSTTAYLMGDHARASMLTALLDGRAWSAGELAYASGVTAQTASSHLGKLLDGGLVSMEKQGRHHYYRLSGPHVAQALEQLSVIQPTATMRKKVASPLQRELGFCRSCYNHLAGKLGVAITNALLEKHYLSQDPGGGQYAITSAGKQWLQSLGIDLRQMKPASRGLIYPCLDWTERRHHLAGPVASRLLITFCENDWLRRAAKSRAITVTPAGWLAFREHLAIDAALLDGHK